MVQAEWNVVQDAYESNNNKKYETIFTLANGYRGLRGSLEFSKIGNQGNFIAGIFDKSKSQVTEIVNCQDPLVLNIYFEDEVVDFDKCLVLHFKRYLNMKEGILYLKSKIKTPKGKIINISTERYVSRENVHRWAAKYTISCENFSGNMFVENMIDGNVANNSYDPSSILKHIFIEQAYDMSPGIALISSTLEKHIKIIESSALISGSYDCIQSKFRKYRQSDDKVCELYQIPIYPNTKYEFYKLGCTYSSMDCNDIADSCKYDMASFIAYGYEKEKSDHISSMKDIWSDIDIKIDGDERAQVGIRFNLFQLSSSAYECGGRVSIAAKGLHGEGYKGHVFWDTEIFMLPFFIYTMPDIARSLLLYRYNTLNGARKNALANGYKGAQFPWESADDGLDVTPKWGLDYNGKLMRIWPGEEECHISSDITFAIWEYYRATLDKEFMLNFGAEIFFDTANFWKSKVEYNPIYDKYEIKKVIGPDEFHEHVNNNAYTNCLVKWSLKKAVYLADWVKDMDIKVFEKLCAKLNLNNNDFKQWDIIQQKMYIPCANHGKLIEEFEGYFDLADSCITRYDKNGMPLWPDLKGKNYSETQLVKQADVVMLMIMLGDEFDYESKYKSYKYYKARTMHKSSLSPSMYSIMGVILGDTRNSYKYFMKTVLTDLEDNQANTIYGFHAASAGGAWQSAVLGFGGLSVDKYMMLNFNPWIPDFWNSLSFNIIWHGSKISVKIMHDKILISSSKDVKIKVFSKEYTICSKKNYSIIK